MKIIISPAKKMNIKTDDFPIDGKPKYLDDAKLLYSVIRQKSYEELKKLWKCNDKLAELNFKRFAEMDLETNLTPAILSYEGLQYQHMAPVVFTDTAIEYVRKHLRILSGFYGVLSPFDGVTPYRLEMQAALAAGGKKDLYDFWGGKLYKAVVDDDRIIINLASREYSKAVEKYLTPEDRMFTLVFGELVSGRVIQKGTLAKMARGEMVRYMAENQITELEKVKDFKALGFQYSEEYSTGQEWTFLKNKV